ncbi:hypothetical protein SAMN05421831_101271 [Allopseudospirillum japonicum]|uniref:Uncharacterized protein n=1 Tax=Allopseudospirillum japonicum TaxID=64971 RepID=A0A1H6QD79_9GAMM|nr:DUF6482 family protein [Allopseudospirillum japonicum]SEI39826.1 hypothetical protein SAMN05421831_101271 [Allopseudospirillum japonicum]
MMHCSELKRLAKRGEDFEVHVLTHAASRYYQVQIQYDDEAFVLSSLRNKPMVFRSLDEVYQELRRHGISRAYLVQHVANDEMIGRMPTYHAPHVSHMPLSF